MHYSQLLFSTLLASSVNAVVVQQRSTATNPVTTPSPTNVICNVNYAKTPANQPVIESCCKNAGGYPINFKEAKIEGCQNLILRSPQNLQFVGCVQDKLKVTPACSNADPVPVPSFTHPNPVTGPSFTHPNPVTVASPTHPNPVTTSRPTNVICNVDYSKKPSDQPVIESCCSSAGGYPINFKEAKIEGCQNLILRSPQNLQFVGCVQDKLKMTPACSNADPVPVSSSTTANPVTTPSPTNVICNVDYSKKPSNQPIIESCCSSAGGYPINFKEAKFEGCQNLILRSPQNLNFVNCIQTKLHMTPACSNADPVPVPVSSTTTAPAPTLTPVYCDVNYGRNPSRQHALGDCCHRANGKPEDLKSSRTERCDGLILRGPAYDKFIGCAVGLGFKPACYNAARTTATTTPTPTASVAPVPTNVICTVNYAKKPAEQPVVESCCKSAGGLPENFKEAKLEGCQNLKIGSKAQNEFVSCVRQKLGADSDIECQTASPV